MARHDCTAVGAERAHHPANGVGYAGLALGILAVLSSLLLVDYLFGSLASDAGPGRVGRRRGRRGHQP